MNEGLNLLIKSDINVLSELKNRFGDQIISTIQPTNDETLTIWIVQIHLLKVLNYLKTEIILPFRMLDRKSVV